MERSTMQQLMVLALLLFLAKPTSSFLRKGCFNELALVKQACLILPETNEEPELSQNAESHHGHGRENGIHSGHSHEGGHGHVGHAHSHEGGHGHERGQSHEDGHEHSHEGGHGHVGHAHRHEGGHGHERGQSHEDGHEHSHEGGRGHGDGHSHGHGMGHGHSHKGGHGHGHEHRHHRGKDKVDPANKECCRWLKELDDICVCELLVGLPRFLVKLNHTYNVAVKDTCNVTFTCPGFTGFHH